MKKFTTLKLEDGGEVILPLQDIKGVGKKSRRTANILGDRIENTVNPFPPQTNGDSIFTLYVNTMYEPYRVKRSTYNRVKKYLLSIEESTEQAMGTNSQSLNPLGSSGSM